MNPELDTVTIVLLAIVIAFVAIVFLVGITAKINDFSHDLDYLNREIACTRVQNANTGNVRRDAFGYHFCRFTADKGYSNEK